MFILDRSGVDTLLLQLVDNILLEDLEAKLLPFTCLQSMDLLNLPQLL